MKIRLNSEYIAKITKEKGRNEYIKQLSMIDTYRYRRKRPAAFFRYLELMSIE